MRSIWYVLAGLWLFAASPAMAQNMEQAFANTLVTENAEGQQTRWAFAADGTYTATGPDGAAVTGAWEAREGLVCLTEAGAAEPSCLPLLPEEAAVGAVWTVAKPDGAQLRATLTPRQE